MGLELLLDLGCPYQEFSCCAVDLSLHVELIALDLESCGTIVRLWWCLSQNQALLSHVLFDFLKSNVGVGYVVGDTEICQWLWLACQTSLNFEDVEERLTSNLTCMGTQENVLTGFYLHLVRESDRLSKFEIFEQCLRKLGKAIRVRRFLPHYYRKRDRLQSVVLEKSKLNSWLISLGTWLIVGSSEEEGTNHVSHEMLRTKLDNVQEIITKVHTVCEQSSEHAVSVLSGKREHKWPVKKPACLVQHSHWALCETGSHHVFDFADSCEFSAFTRLLELNLAGKKAPEDLRYELVVRVCLSSQDLL